MICFCAKLSPLETKTNAMSNSWPQFRQQKSEIKALMYDTCFSLFSTPDICLNAWLLPLIESLLCISRQTHVFFCTAHLQTHKLYMYNTHFPMTFTSCVSDPFVTVLIEKPAVNIFVKSVAIIVRCFSSVSTNARDILGHNFFTMQFLWTLFCLLESIASKNNLLLN